MPSNARRAKKRAYHNAKAASGCQSITTFFCTDSSEPRDETTTTVLDQSEYETENNTEQTPTSTSQADNEPSFNIESTNIPSSSKKHLVGRKAVLELNFNWLIIQEEYDEINQKNGPVLYCKLCKKFNTRTSNGRYTWVTEGFKVLRKDKVKEHLKSAQHAESVRLETQEQINRSRQDTSFTEQEVSVSEQLVEVMFYLVKHNLPLQQFPNLVDLCIKNGSNTLLATRQGFNATYTSPDSINQLLEILSIAVEEELLPEMQSSLSYSIMVDEVCDKSVTKNLGVIIKYINKKGESEMKFLHDVEMVRSTGEDIKQATLYVLGIKGLDPSRCTNLTSDGASSFAGKHKGAAALLKKDGGMPHAIVMHCHDHRLALACRDAFAAVPNLDSVAEGLDSLFKYYKYSSVSSATLRGLQEMYHQAAWRIQQAKHHRWLSYDKAVMAVLKGLSIVRQDLENASSKETNDDFTRKHKIDATALLKWITQEKTVRMLCLLGDVLPHLAELSLVFQRRSVDITFIQPKLQGVLALLEKRKTETGTWEKKLLNGPFEDRADIRKQDCNETQFETTVKIPFLSALQRKLENRFENVEIISHLGALAVPIEVLDSLPLVYREESIRHLATHFDIDEIVLLEEWVQWLEVLKNLQFQELGGNSPLPVLGKLLLQIENNSVSQDFSRNFPNLRFLYSVVNSLSLSSAEVERLFSHVAIVKSDRRSSLSNKSLNRILNVKLNVGEHLIDNVKGIAAKKWLQAKSRRFGRYLVP